MKAERYLGFVEIDIQGVKDVLTPDLARAFAAELIAIANQIEPKAGMIVEFSTVVKTTYPDPRPNRRGA